MISKIIFAAIILFSVVINSCKEEMEFNIDLIPGGYTDSAFYSSTGEFGGVSLFISDSSNR